MMTLFKASISSCADFKLLDFAFFFSQSLQLHSRICFYRHHVYILGRVKTRGKDTVSTMSHFVRKETFLEFLPKEIFLKLSL